jgi:hypothetical protein
LNSSGLKIIPWIFLLLLYLPGCTRSLKIPDAEDIDYIIIRKVQDSESKLINRITDKKTIQKIRSFIADHNGSWYIPLLGPGTYPCSQGSVVLCTDQGHVLFVIYLSPGWAGGRTHVPEQSQNYYWKLKEEDLKTLNKLVGLNFE